MYLPGLRDMHTNSQVENPSSGARYIAIVENDLTQVGKTAMCDSSQTGDQCVRCREWRRCKCLSYRFARSVLPIFFRDKEQMILLFNSQVTGNAKPDPL